MTADRLAAIPEDIGLHRVSGEFTDPTTEDEFRAELLASRAHLYGQIAMVIAVVFSLFALVDLASLGWSPEFAFLLGARLTASGLVLHTRRRLLRRPSDFVAAPGLDLITVTQLVVYTVVLIACALRPADAATNAVSAALLVLGGMVVVPGRYAIQATTAAATLTGFAVVSAVCFHDPELAMVPLAANLVVAQLWGMGILRMTNRDTRRRWDSVRRGRATNGRLEHELAVADELRSELQLQTRRDPLTSAANRRELLRCAQEMLDDRRADHRGSLLILDADRFKSINDRFGHGAGDATLVSLVAAVRSAVRSPDVVARIGGEEFAVLLPGLAGEAAVATAERVRAAVEQMTIPGGDAIALTVSIGVAEAEPGDTIERLMARADAAMYRVKRTGGNSVGTPASDPTGPEPEPGHPHEPDRGPRSCHEPAMAGLVQNETWGGALDASGAS